MRPPFAGKYISQTKEAGMARTTQKKDPEQEARKGNKREGRSDDSRLTPSQAEGDRETVEQDLKSASRGSRR